MSSERYKRSVRRLAWWSVVLMIVSLLTPVLGLLKAQIVHASGGNATQFMETPDAVNNASGDTSKIFWTQNAGTVTFDTGTKFSGLGSWKVDSTGSNVAASLKKSGVMADAGRRLTLYINFAQRPSSEAEIIEICTTNCGSNVFVMTIDSSGVLRLRATNATGQQIGSNGSTLSTGTWYRIAMAYTVTSTTSYSIKTYINGNSTADINGSNSPTLAATGSTVISIGWHRTPGASKVFYFQNLYIDNGTSLDDPGDIRITAKRPNANGSANGFTTQVGSGGSGYGSGHSPQVNERPLSTTNGWQAPTTSGKKTEGYAIESASTGDTNISNYSVVAYTGWLYANTSGSGGIPTNNILLNGVATSITLSATATLFTKTNDSSTYPSTAEVIGIDHTGTARASQLLEAGILVAYTPIISVSVSDGSVAYGTLDVNTSKDTTSGGVDDSQTATNDGSEAEDFNIKGQSSAAWTLSAAAGSEQYVHYFCTTGSGSPDPCDSGPTWTALTTSYQSLGTNIAANGTKKFDLKITTPTATSSTSQQSVDVTVQAVAH